MKRLFVLFLLLVPFCSQAETNAKPAAPAAETKAAAETPSAEKKDEPKKEESRVSRDTNGNVVIKLDVETQKLIQLKAEPLVASQLSPELKAYGRVLDPAPLAALVTELATAQAAYAASSNELARLKILSTSGNASARALQSAEAAEQHDRLAAQSARDRLVMAWGKWIVEQHDLPAFLQTLTALDNALIRVDLSASQQFPASPTGARIVGLSGRTAEAEVLGRALSVDPQTQGQGLLLQLKNNDSRFLVGEAVTGFLKLPGEPLNGVNIPRAAIVRAEGAAWVYVQNGEGQFTRKQIALDRPVEGGWFITEGIAPGDKVVLMGAQTLLSEELKGAFGAPD